MPFKYPSMQERILANSISSPWLEHTFNGTACWLWLRQYRWGNRDTAYGVLTVRFKHGPRKGKVKKELVHRVVIRVFKNRILSFRMKGMHLCNNTWCCNPEHLMGGTQKQNVRQTVREGRHRNQHTGKLVR